MGGRSHSREHMSMLAARGAAANAAKNPGQQQRAALMRWYPESFQNARKAPAATGASNESKNGETN